MNVNIKRLTLGVVTLFTAIALLAACHSRGEREHKKLKVVNDCSSVFETRSVSKGEKVSVKNGSKSGSLEGESSNISTECKILEFKLDNNKCEVVGSDRIDDLSTLLNENKSDKIILVTPKEKLRDLGKVAEKYLSTNGVNVNINKYFDSDIFNNMQFPYRGMRCEISDMQFVVWSGEDKVILTIGEK